MIRADDKRCLQAALHLAEARIIRLTGNGAHRRGARPGSDTRQLLDLSRSPIGPGAVMLEASSREPPREWQQQDRSSLE